MYFDPVSRRYYRYLVTDTNVAQDSNLPFDPNSTFQEIRRQYAQPKVETIGLTPAWNLSDQKWASIQKWSQNVSDMEPDKPNRNLENRVKNKSKNKNLKKQN